MLWAFQHVQAEPPYNDEVTAEVQWEAERRAGTSVAPMTNIYDGQRYIAMTVGDSDDGAERVTFALRDEDMITCDTSV